MSDRPAFRIRPALAPAEMPLVATLFREYADWLEVDLRFQGFEEELAGLPGKYVPPAGGLWLAEVEGETAGCVALRALQDTGEYPRACEMKRLWLREPYRALGLGRRLSEAAIEAAREAGYGALRLDTLGFMLPAVGLYRSLGFREIPAYYHNPHPDVVYLELSLIAEQGADRAALAGPVRVSPDNERKG